MLDDFLSRPDSEMTQTLTSSNGDCPLCKSGNWKTLEALALSDRTRASSTMTGHRPGHRRETEGSETSEAAAQHARPPLPTDYDQMERYRKECAKAIAAAEARLAEIDAAWRQPKEMLPSFLRGGPDAKAAAFNRNAGNLLALQQFDADLALWKATRTCLRCAATFVDARTRIEQPAPMLFQFAGQERRCPHCQSYFWKDPAAVATHLEQSARDALTRARQQLRDAEEAERDAAARPAPSGMFQRLAAFLTLSPMSVEEARAELASAERVYQRAMEKPKALRERVEGHKGMRWCASCEEVYPGAFATGASV